MNIMMISADLSVTAGDKGPFYYMLEEFSRHFDRIDVIGLKPARRRINTIFSNVHLNHPDTGKLMQPFFIRKTAIRLMKERKYDFAVSHDYNFFYNGFGAYLTHRKTGLPYISEIHHVPGYPRAATFRERVDRFCTRLYTRWVQKHALAIRVVNEKELASLLFSWGVKPDKVKVLHSLYIDFDTFKPKETGKDYDLMFCGRLAPNKGLFLILDAVKKMKTEKPDIKLLIVGRGSLKDQIHAIVNRSNLSDNVEFIDWVAEFSELADLYRRSKILVCASFNEGGPRVTVEAMACGTPAISTPVGIMNELISDGENGLLFSWDADELAAKSLQLLKDEKQYKAVSSRLKETVAPFERTKVIAKLADGFKKLVINK